MQEKPPHPTSVPGAAGRLPIALALAFSVAIAIAGWRLGGLTRAGALAAVPVGTAILGFTGWPGMAALGTFFVGASAISRLAPDRSVEFLDAKGHSRDPWQVLANGGAAAAAAALEPFLPGAGIWLVTASLAAAAADTWATSAGGWSPSPPRHVLTWHPVPAGTSGGITLAGTFGALLGAGLVGAAAVAAGAPRPLFPTALLVGMLGMLADSVLGAAGQGRFHCTACGRDSERTVHRCGRPTVHTGGARWLTNDGVNALATSLGAILGLGAWRLVH